MPHQRQLIRQHVASMLLALPSAPWGANVAATALVPWPRVKLPAVSVYTLEESSDDEDTGPRYYRRELQVVIEVGTEVVAAIDDVLDGLALQVEAAMATDYTLAGLCRDSTLQATEIEITELGNKPIGFARLQYLVTYYSDLADIAPVTLNDFATADTKYNLNDLQLDADQAEDTLTDLNE